MSILGRDEKDNLVYAVKYLMSKHEDKANTEFTSVVNPKIAAVIKEVQQLEEFFEANRGKSIKIDQELTDFLLRKMSKLKKLIYTHEFPDEKLKKDTNSVISRLEPLTPPRTIVFSKQQLRQRTIQPTMVPPQINNLQSSDFIYNLDRFELEEEKSCCFNPITWAQRLLCG